MPTTVPNNPNKGDADANVARRSGIFQDLGRHATFHFHAFPHILVLGIGIQGQGL